MLFIAVAARDNFPEKSHENWWTVHEWGRMASAGDQKNKKYTVFVPGLLYMQDRQSLESLIELGVKLDTTVCELQVIDLPHAQTGIIYY